MTRILVTGAGGFVGREVIAQLQASGHEVHGVYGSGVIPEGQTVRAHRLNLLDPRAVSELLADVQPQLLVHLAWCAKPGSYWSSAENLAWVAATLHLLEAFRLHAGEAAVIAGTCAEYDWRYGYCQEALTPLQPNTVYGRSKNATRELCEIFTQVHDLPIAWGRIFQVYGPHEAAGRLLPAVCQGLLRGEETRCSHAQQLRDFIHIKDVAAALLHLLEKRAAGAFNIASGQPTKLQAVVEYLASQLGRQDLLRFGAITAPAGDPPLLVADIAKLTSLGWRAEMDLYSGLDATLAWWQGSIKHTTAG
jgi:nucleoside-diphosphate-sugar epimerase